MWCLDCENQDDQAYSRQSEVKSQKFMKILKKIILKKS